MRHTKAVGYCTQESCGERYRGVFCINHNSDNFWCPACRQTGFLVTERVTVKNENPLFGEVRVEWKYDPEYREYCGLTVVRRHFPIEWGTDFNVYTLYSPLIRTEKRSTNCATAVLGHLDYTPIEEILSGETVRAREQIMDLDCTREEWQRQIKELSLRLHDNHYHRFAQSQEKDR